jgi:hypothetical protein
MDPNSHRVSSTTVATTAVFALAIALAACTPSREPVSARPAAEATAAAVAPRPIAETAPPIGASAPPAIAIAPGAAPRPPASAIAAPPGAPYVCVSESGGTPRQTAIEYAAKTEALCRKHPEMGPCQYERNACRRSGGRVYAADGTEITLATEAEYDRKVRRVRFKAN